MNIFYYITLVRKTYRIYTSFYIYIDNQPNEGQGTFTVA